ncbi:hypothetical protein IDJ75_03525 [Mucilaginibacter rigui]|uniref:Uncharacterized protein n=1 Tax=Mucilaginibacter rigui TaxID=534635 RepID=A0ABR7X2V0_9SPHI|nr:hypothetical protein [Mucilaginibacter rigui]
MFYQPKVPMGLETLFSECPAF